MSLQIYNRYTAAELVFVGRGDFVKVGNDNGLFWVKVEINNGAQFTGTNIIGGRMSFSYDKVYMVWKS
jgi:hypothetical protein